jgi:hypothetical protein
MPRFQRNIQHPSSMLKSGRIYIGVQEKAEGVDQSGMRYKGEKGLDQQEVSKWVM